MSEEGSEGVSGRVKILGEEGDTEKPEEGRPRDGKDPNDVPDEQSPARTCPRRGKSYTSPRQQHRGLIRAST